jgi:NADH:ubiquinone oxidoreductase subunit 3 (subunit A)
MASPIAMMVMPAAAAIVVIWPVIVIVVVIIVSVARIITPVRNTEAKVEAAPATMTPATMAPTVMAPAMMPTSFGHNALGLWNFDSGQPRRSIGGGRNCSRE